MSGGMLPDAFLLGLGHYGATAGHIEHALHEMLPGWQSGQLLQDEIKARKAHQSLLARVKRSVADLPEELAREVTEYCEELKEKLAFRHRAVHGAWFPGEGDDLLNLYFDKDKTGHLAPVHPVRLTWADMDEALRDVERLLVRAHELRDAIRSCRGSPGHDAREGGDSGGEVADPRP